jgi:hypothetical protein
MYKTRFIRLIFSFLYIKTINLLYKFLLKRRLLILFKKGINFKIKRENIKNI